MLTLFCVYVSNSVENIVVFRWATQQQQQQQQKSFRILSQDNDFVACQSGAVTVAAGFYSAARSVVPASQLAHYILSGLPGCKRCRRRPLLSLRVAAHVQVTWDCWVVPRTVCAAVVMRLLKKFQRKSRNCDDYMITYWMCFNCC